MKTVILAGGLGSRLSEETLIKPKPMVEIGGMPILWHIMKSCSVHGLTTFVICLGYKGYMIKEYFANYFLHMSDVTVDLSNNAMHVHHRHAEPWKITLVDTGEHTMTGGRLKRVAPYLDDGEDFCFTYGDGLSDVNLTRLIAFHRRQRTWATLTSVVPPGRFGVVQLNRRKVKIFHEKPLGEGGWINGGFFVLSSQVMTLLRGDRTVWEREPLETLAKRGNLSAYRHKGFWYAMDTLRDKTYLEELWRTGKAPWKTWA